MGHTSLAIALQYAKERKRLERFARALLSRQDQLALRDLLDRAEKHLAAAEHADYPLPINAGLLSMILEQEKEIRRLHDQLAILKGTYPADNLLAWEELASVEKNEDG